MNIVKSAVCQYAGSRYSGCAFVSTVSKSHVSALRRFDTRAFITKYEGYTFWRKKVKPWKNNCGVPWWSWNCHRPRLESAARARGWRIRSRDCCWTWSRRSLPTFGLIFSLPWFQFKLFRNSNSSPCLTNALSSCVRFSDFIVVSELASDTEFIAFVVKDLVAVVRRVVVRSFLAAATLKIRYSENCE